MSCFLDKQFCGLMFALRRCCDFFDFAMMSCMHVSFDNRDTGLSTHLDEPPRFFLCKSICKVLCGCVFPSFCCGYKNSCCLKNPYSLKVPCMLIDAIVRQSQCQCQCQCQCQSQCQCQCQMPMPMPMTMPMPMPVTRLRPMCRTWQMTPWACWTHLASAKR